MWTTTRPNKNQLAAVKHVSVLSPSSANRPNRVLKTFTRRVSIHVSPSPRVKLTSKCQTVWKTLRCAHDTSETPWKYRPNAIRIENINSHVYKYYYYYFVCARTVNAKRFDTDVFLYDGVRACFFSIYEWYSRVSVIFYRSLRQKKLWRICTFYKRVPIIIYKCRTYTYFISIFFFFY